MVIYATPRESEKARHGLQPNTEYDTILTEELAEEGLQHFYRICPWDVMIHAHYIFKKDWINRNRIPDARKAIAVIDSDSQSVKEEHQKALALCHNYSGLQIRVVKEGQKQALERVAQRLESRLNEKVVLS